MIETTDYTIVSSHQAFFAVPANGRAAGRMVGMERRHVRLSDPLAVPLLEGLTEEYDLRYGSNDEMRSVAADEFEPPHGDFLVFVEDGVVIAGGGLRRISPGVGEIKRMWTAPDQRRRGLASTVLDALEEVATERGYKTLVLETGPAQPEAQALYARRGYRRIPTYGRYDLAVAFEHRLGGGEQPSR